VGIGAAGGIACVGAVVAGRGLAGFEGAVVVDEVACFDGVVAGLEEPGGAGVSSAVVTAALPVAAAVSAPAYPAVSLRAAAAAALR